MGETWKKSLLAGSLISLAGAIILLAGCSSGETTDDTASATEAAEAAVSAAFDDCAGCHNDGTDMVARQVQWENSLHGSGFTFERNGADCAGCHTGEGLALRQMTDIEEYELSEAVMNPSPVNCRTCHNIHETYTVADWSLRSDSPVTVKLTGDTLDIGNGNLCINCHQPRVTVLPEFGSTEPYEITSTRFGPHHGPQGTMVAGIGGYGEYTGSNVHYLSITDGCTTCHMADAYGKQSGGHTMSTGYEYHGSMVQNVAGCISCHPDIEEFDFTGRLAEIEELAAQVHELLVAQGLITETGSGITGTFTSEQAGALWNYKTFEEDRSGGVHNAAFAEFLLETALEALQ